MENREKIKKINIDDDIKLTHFRDLPPEALSLLGNIVEKQEEEKPKKEIIEKKPNIVIPPPPPPPTIIKKNIELENNINYNDEIKINEDGYLFNLKIEVSNKTDVLNTMKDKSKENIDIKNNIFKYNDIGISFHFSNFSILDEIYFSYPFKGKTIRGLSINDDVNKAIKLYGEPKIRTIEGAIWNKISIFLKDDIITSIRIKK